MTDAERLQSMEKGWYDYAYGNRPLNAGTKPSWFKRTFNKRYRIKGRRVS